MAQCELLGILQNCGFWLRGLCSVAVRPRVGACGCFVGVEAVVRCMSICVVSVITFLRSLL